MMRPKPLGRSQPFRSAKIDKKQRYTNKPNSNHNNNNSNNNKTIKTDESVLKQSMKTCINGLDKVIKVLENGTEEVVDFLSNECSIIYECRVCLSLFRSLANFISHKRIYCRDKVSDMQRNFDGQIEEKVVSVTSDFQKGILSSRSTSKRDIVNFLDSLKINKGTTNETSPDLFGLELDATKEALFHCFKHEGKQCSEERTATLGPDGRILGSPRRPVNGSSNLYEENVNNNGDRSSSPSNVSVDENVSYSYCLYCPKKFSSERSLQLHAKSLHSVVTRTCYTCPCCKKFLANAWSVYRHLSKVHKKSNEQIRRLRAQIQKKQFSEEETTKTAKVSSSLNHNLVTSPNEQDKMNFESRSQLYDAYSCNICGKRFERRVTLLAHTHMCREDHGVSSPSTLSDGLVNNRPRIESPPSPPITKSGIEVRMYYDKNKVATTSAGSSGSSSDTTHTTDCLQLKPTALALLASLPKARVVLTKTPVLDSGAIVNSRVPPTIPSPPPSIRQFSPRAEDIISRYRNGKPGLNNNGDGCSSPTNSIKVHVESVTCSDSEETNSDCEQYILGARDIAKCIGTVSDTELIDCAYVSVNNNTMKDLNNTNELIKHDKESEVEERELGVSCSTGGLERVKKDAVIDIEENGNNVIDRTSERKKSLIIRKRKRSSDNEIQSMIDTESDKVDEEDGDGDDENDYVREDNEDNEQILDKCMTPITRKDGLTKDRTWNYCLKKRKVCPTNGVNLKFTPGKLSHRINTFIDGTKKKCLLCMKTFYRHYLLRRHVAHHLNLSNFKCNVASCDFKTVYKTDLSKHLLKAHKRNSYVTRNDSDIESTDDDNTSVSITNVRNNLGDVHRLSLTERSQSKHDISNLALSETQQTNCSSPIGNKNNILIIPPTCISSEGDADDDDYEDNRKMASTSGGRSKTITDHSAYNTNHIQMYDTDLDELIINAECDSNDDKLRALMMQVIFGSGNVKRTSSNDQISDCASANTGTLLDSTTSDLASISTH